ncbi:carcinoembryonic antigen-related cell adhesion molecule 6-like [Thunnus albacares]|uniref:carcinoembryonic antigen-related cell adhesion molecule 6-like n=1 Tax=Thunnus albacares TaxID=8236 RepID=UPI001CF6C47C|nr:carcinoembryonic antigen-related cell adhesion molecule 6-like [Thunnus albacares]
MLIKHKNLTWTLMLLFLPDVLCNMLKVEYQQQHICTVKGLSAVIQCSFYHTDNLRIKRVQWGRVKNHGSIFDGKVINTTPRFQYIGDKHHNCSLKIRQVNHDDKGLYTIRFFTSNKKVWRPGKAGPTLKVVDLNILVTKSHGNETVMEGESVNLTCINSCDDINVSSAFTWFKNGEPIHEGPVLYLRNMSSTSSGNYTCSLKKHTGTTSRVLNIDVQYGPKNTSVSIRPSPEVDAGSNVTLICSSHANPPVENYTWFKIHDDDDDDIMTVGHEPLFFPGNGGQYLCSATNTHGSQNSSVVTLKMKVYWATATRDILIIAIVAVFLIVTTAVIRLNKKMTWAPTTDCEEDIQNTDYVNWLICYDNQREANQCEGRTTELIYTSVYFKTNRESNMEQRFHSHNDDDEGVVYSTVCRNQQLNPTSITTNICNFLFLFSSLSTQKVQIKEKKNAIEN